MISSMIILVLVILLVIATWYIGCLKIDLDYERKARKNSNKAYDDLNKDYKKWIAKMERDLRL